jgi:hypothetical protein
VHSDVGGGEPPDSPTDETALSDITLSWMMAKAAALGVQFDAEAAAQYKAPMDPKYALDTLHTSWNILCGFPRPRNVPAGAALSNSVRIRCEHDPSYRPANLSFEGGALSKKYAFASVAKEPELAAAAGG